MVTLTVNSQVSDGTIKVTCTDATGLTLYRTEGNVATNVSDVTLNTSDNVYTYTISGTTYTFTSISLGDAGETEDSGLTVGTYYTYVLINSAGKVQASASCRSLKFTATSTESNTTQLEWDGFDAKVLIYRVPSTVELKYTEGTTTQSLSDSTSLNKTLRFCNVSGLSNYSSIILASASSGSFEDVNTTAGRTYYYILVEDSSTQAYVGAVVKYTGDWSIQDLMSANQTEAIVTAQNNVAASEFSYMLDVTKGNNAYACLALLICDGNDKTISDWLSTVELNSTQTNLVPLAVSEVGVQGEYYPKLDGTFKVKYIK